MPDPTPTTPALTPLQIKMKALQASEAAKAEAQLRGRPAEVAADLPKPEGKPVAFRPEIRDPETGREIKSPGVAAASLPPFAEEQSGRIMASGTERPALLGERMEVAAGYSMPSSEPISREAVEEAAKVEWWAPIQNLEVFDYARRALWHGSAWAAQALPDEGTAAGDALQALVGAAAVMDARMPDMPGDGTMGTVMNLTLGVPWALMPDRVSLEEMAPALDAAEKYMNGEGSLTEVVRANARVFYPEFVDDTDYRKVMSENLYRAAASGEMYEKSKERRGYIEWGLPFVEVTGESWRTPNLLGSDILDAAVPPAMAADIRDQQDRSTPNGEAAWRYWDALTTDVGREVVGLGYEIAYDPMWFLGPAKGGQVVAKGESLYRLGRPVVRAAGSLARLGKMDADQAGRILLNVAVGTAKEREAALELVEQAAKMADEQAALAMARAANKAQVVGEANLRGFKGRLAARAAGVPVGKAAVKADDLAAIENLAARHLDDELAHLKDLEEAYHLNPGAAGELKAVRQRIASLEDAAGKMESVPYLVNSGRMDLLEARLLTQEAQRIRSAAKMAQGGEHVVKQGRLAVHIPFSDNTRFLVKGNSLIPEPLARQLGKVGDLVRPPSMESLAAKLAASPGAAVSDVLSRGEQLAYAMGSVNNKAKLWGGYVYDWLASSFGSRWIQPHVAYLRTMAELEALGTRGRAVGAVSDRLGLRIVALRSMEPELWNRYQGAVTKYMRSLAVDEANLLQRVRRLSREAERVARARREAALRGDAGANPAWAEPTYGGEQVLMEAGNAIETGAGLLDERPELEAFAAIAKELTEYIAAAHGKDIEEVRQSLVAIQRWGQGNPALMRRHKAEMADLERHAALLSEAREVGAKEARAAEEAAHAAAEVERKANHAIITAEKVEDEEQIVEIGKEARTLLSQAIEAIRDHGSEEVAGLKLKAKTAKAAVAEARALTTRRKESIAAAHAESVAERKAAAKTEIEQIKAGLKEAEERHANRLALAAEEEARVIEEAKLQYQERLKASAAQKAAQEELRDEMLEKIAEVEVPKRKTKAAMAAFNEKKKGIRASYENRIRQAAEMEKKLADPLYVKGKENEAKIALKDSKKASAAAVRAEKDGVKAKVAEAKASLEADIKTLGEARDAAIAEALAARDALIAESKAAIETLKGQAKQARVDAETLAASTRAAKEPEIARAQAEARAHLAERVEEQRSFTQDLAWSARTKASAARHAALQKLDEAKAAGEQAIARRGEEIKAILAEVTPRLQPPDDIGKPRVLAAWEEDLWSRWREKTGQSGFDTSKASITREMGEDGAERIKVSISHDDDFGWGVPVGGRDRAEDAIITDAWERLTLAESMLESLKSGNRAERALVSEENLATLAIKEQVEAAQKAISTLAPGASPEREALVRVLQEGMESLERLSDARPQKVEAAMAETAERVRQAKALAGDAVAAMEGRSLSPGAGVFTSGTHDPADLLLAAYSALRHSPTVPNPEFVKKMGDRYPQILGQRLGDMPDDLVPVAEEMGAIIKSYEALYEKHGFDFIKNPTSMLRDWGVVGYVPHIEASETVIARKGGGAAAVAEAKGIEKSLSTAMDSAKKRSLKGSIAEINALTENSQLTLTLDPSAIVSRYIQANRAMAADDFLDALLEGGVLRIIEPGDGRGIAQVALDEDLVPLFQTGGDHRQGDMMERLLEHTREDWIKEGFTPEEAMEMLRPGHEGPLATWVGESKVVQQGVNLERILGATRAADFQAGAELTNPKRMFDTFSASGMSAEEAWKAVADYLNARSRAMGVGVQTSPGSLARYYGESGPTYRMYVPRMVERSMHDIFEVETSLKKWARESRVGEAVATAKGLADGFNNWWKARVTILAAAFTTRNALSNVVSNILDVGVHGALSIKTNVMASTLAALAPYVDTYGSFDAALRALAAPPKPGESLSKFARRRAEMVAFSAPFGGLNLLSGGSLLKGEKWGALGAAKFDLGDGVLRTLDEIFTILREKQVIAPSYQQVVDLDRFSADVAEMMAATKPGLSWEKVKSAASTAEDVGLVMLSAGIGGVPVALPKGFGAGVSRLVENQARTVNFIANLRRSGNVEESAAHVQKFLFNYSDLTGTQKVWMRTLVPFFTWTQKNVALQLDLMKTHPYLYAQYNRLLVDGLPRAAEAYNASQRGESYYEPMPGRQYNLKARQQHALGRIRLPLPGGEKGQYIEGLGTPQEALMEQVAMVGGMAEGVANMVALTGAMGEVRQEMARLAQYDDKKPFLRFLSQTHLWIKMGAELASQQSLFYDRPINRLNNGRLIGATMRGLREMPITGPVFGGFLAEDLREMTGYHEIASSQYPDQAVVFGYSNYGFMNVPYSRVIRDSAAASDLYHTSMAAEILSGQPAEVHPLSPFWRYADAAAGIRVVSEDPSLQRSVMQDRLNESLSGYYESRGLTGSRKSEYIKKR